jgi:hypothetical protein
MSQYFYFIISGMVYGKRNSHYVLHLSRLYLRGNVTQRGFEVLQRCGHKRSASLLYLDALQLLHRTKRKTQNSWLQVVSVVSVLSQ